MVAQLVELLLPTVSRSDSQPADHRVSLGSQALLLRSYRHFIANNIGSVCRDDSEFAQKVNMILVRIDEESARLAIPEEDALELVVHPDVLETNAHVYLFWQKNGSKEMMDDYRRLAETKQRDRQSWDVRLQLFLDQYRRWQQETHEPELVRFSETCMMYAGLLDIVPPGNIADQIITEYVGYLQSSSVLFDDAPLWDLQVVRLIHQCCSQRQKAAGTRTTDLSKYVTQQSAVGVIAALNAALAPPLNRCGETTIKENIQQISCHARPLFFALSST